MSSFIAKSFFIFLSLTLCNCVYATEIFTRYTLYGVRYELIIFGAMLVGVAIFYKKTMNVAIIGLLSLCFYKYEFVDGFSVISKLLGHYNDKGEFVFGSFNTYLNLALMLPSQLQ